MSSGLPQTADITRCGRHVSKVPCVDGSGLARGIFTLQAWSVQPCVRPLSAVHMTAGHNLTLCALSRICVGPQLAAKCRLLGQANSPMRFSGWPLPTTLGKRRTSGEFCTFERPAKVRASTAAKPESLSARQSPRPCRARAGNCRYAHRLVPLIRVRRRACGSACGRSPLETGTVSRCGFWLRISWPSEATMGLVVA
jgi:hypothetical protein